MLHDGQRKTLMVRKEKALLVSVIVPIFNEEKTLREIIDRVRALDLPKEIIVVNDCYQDSSGNILEQMTDIRLLTHPVNRGKGAAIRTGLAHVKGDVVVVQDGDLEYNPNDLPILLRPILEGRADVVYGSRFLGRMQGMRMQNVLGNKVLTGLTNVLFGARITDMETCYKMIRTTVLEGIKLRANRFDFEPEITAKILKKKVRFLEVPISYQGRTHLDGKKIGWKDGIQAIYSLVKYRLID